MTKRWLACPHCVMSFEQVDEYKKHHEKDHLGRKYKAPQQIETQTEQ